LFSGRNDAQQEHNEHTRCQVAAEPAERIAGKEESQLFDSIDTLRYLRWLWAFLCCPTWPCLSLQMLVRSGYC
jgi:hypothetical protein